MAGDQGSESKTLAAVIAALQEQGQTQATILAEIVKVANSQDRLTEQVTAIAAEVRKHDETLRGNGKIGLVPQVAQIFTMVNEHQETLRGSEERTGLVGRMKQMEERLDIMSKPVMQVGMIIITAVVTAVIALVVK